jgi:hypothetical protein
MSPAPHFLNQNKQSEREFICGALSQQVLCIALIDSHTCLLTRHMSPFPRMPYRMKHSSTAMPNLFQAKSPRLQTLCPCSRFHSHEIAEWGTWMNLPRFNPYRALRGPPCQAKAPPCAITVPTPQATTGNSTTLLMWLGIIRKCEKPRVPTRQVPKASSWPYEKQI